MCKLWPFVVKQIGFTTWLSYQWYKKGKAEVKQKHSDCYQVQPARV